VTFTALWRDLVWYSRTKHKTTTRPQLAAAKKSPY
jgi:hypothetical protein